MVAMNIGEVLPQVGRRWRRPKHTFYITMRPTVIQPFLIAPVLPGETLKQLLIQSRAISDPLIHPLVGWWLEYYIFYVKHRDLDDRDLLVDMMLDPATNLTPLNDAAGVATYHYGGAPNWTLKCLRRVVDQYFRDEDETWDQSLLDGIPQAHMLNAGDNWMDTLIVDAAMPDIDPNDTSGQALEPQMAAWDYARAMKMTDMTYEEWLATYGVHTAQAPGEAHKPELIRYLREWTYPSNTVDPATGAPTSACSWSIAERADKDRFFREPGWIFGVTCARPKVYLRNLKGSAASLMNNAMTWLPAIMRDEPWTSLKQVPTGGGPATGITDVGGYWIDLKDLLLYGDQFSNVDLSLALSIPGVSLPSISGGKRYAVGADCDGWFKTGTANKIKQDGVVSLAILGAQTDTT